MTWFVWAVIGIAVFAIVLFSLQMMLKSERVHERMRNERATKEVKDKMDKVDPPDGADDTSDRLSGGNF